MIHKAIPLCLLLLLWSPAILPAAKIRVGVVPLNSAEAGSPLITTLIETSLSDESDIVLLDRTEIDAILRERQIAPND